MDSDALYTFRHGGGKSGEPQGTLTCLTPGGLPVRPASSGDAASAQPLAGCLQTRPEGGRIGRRCGVIIRYCLTPVEDADA